ncbi:nucleotide kinase-like protein [candidate division TM7 genomosp. GTL1]|nr:nucleotide kinase-like protein [candidate division TM7 genomosp. GTL1]
MIILLTGKPGSGKSTIIRKLIESYDEPAFWVVVDSIPRPEGGRAGFIARNSLGETRIISHKTDIDSELVIGKNRVDLEAVTHMFGNITPYSNELVILDEIGPIQFLAPGFKEHLDKLFATHTDMIATIHFDNPQVAPYRVHPKIFLLEATQQNRDLLPEALRLVAKNRQTVDALTAPQQKIVFDLLRKALAEQHQLQIEKLLINAIHYVTDGKVAQHGSHRWHVSGHHGEYILEGTASNLQCSCDLFNGRGEYAGSAGECSHIQAVKIQTA